MVPTQDKNNQWKLSPMKPRQQAWRPDKDFKYTILNTFEEPKEAIWKEVKERKNDVSPNREL